MKSSLLIIIILSFSSCFAQNEVRKDSIAILFAYNQSEILHETELLKQLDKMDVFSIAFIRLVGYTDSTGSFARNVALAEERIKSVNSLLKRTKFDRIRVETVNANELSGSRAIPDELNRRVDLLIYGKASVPVSTLSFELNKPLNLNINFIGGKAEFLSESYPNLEKLKRLMQEDATLLLKLHGHVCCANDMELSVKRAEAVMDYLIRNNIDEKRMSAEGFSNSMELVPDDSEAHMSMNRRVEAIFYRKTE